MLKYFISNVIYSYVGKAKFSAVITPVFSVTWFFIYYYRCAASYFCGNQDALVALDFLMNI